MKAYSQDLRQKIVEAYDRGAGTQKQIAQTFGVSQSFVEKLMRRRRTRGKIAALPHGGGVKPALDEQALALVRQLLKDEPDATLQELCEAVHRERAIRVSLSNMSLRLKQMGLPRKKSHSQHQNVTALG